MNAEELYFEKNRLSEQKDALMILKSLSFQGDFKARHSKINQFIFSELKFEFTVKDGILTLEPLSIKIFNGMDCTKQMF